MLPNCVCYCRAGLPRRATRCALFWLRVLAKWSDAGPWWGSYPGPWQTPYLGPCAPAAPMNSLRFFLFNSLPTADNVASCFKNSTALSKATSFSTTERCTMDVSWKVITLILMPSSVFEMPSHDASSQYGASDHPFVAVVIPKDLFKGRSQRGPSKLTSALQQVYQLSSTIACSTQGTFFAKA